MEISQAATAGAVDEGTQRVMEILQMATAGEGTQRMVGILQMATAGERMV